MKELFDFEKIQLQVKKQQMRRNIWLVFFVTLITLMINWGLPKIVNAFFYDPTASNELTSIDSYIVNRQINNELTTQNQFLSRYEITPKGYGNYAITEIYRNLAQNQTLTKTYAINRNHIKENQPSLPENTDVLFMERFRDSSSNMFTESDLYKEQLLEKIKELPKSTEIISTVIFGEDLTLDELAEWQTYNLGDGEILWTAVRSSIPTSEQDYIPLGFANGFSSVLPSEQNFDQFFLEKYPFLSPFHNTQAQITDYSEAQQQAAHFTSMLQYLQTQGDFLALEPDYGRKLLSSGQIADTLAYVEQQGVNTYGVSIRTNVDQLITLLQMGENVLAVRVVETTLFNLYS